MPLSAGGAGSEEPRGDVNAGEESDDDEAEAEEAAAGEAAAVDESDEAGVVAGLEKESEVVLPLAAGATVEGPDEGSLVPSVQEEELAP